MKPTARTNHDVVIIGGCGHVGLPLGLAFADRGLGVALLDLDAAAVDAVNGGRMPFDEPGAPEMLERVLDKQLLHATTDPAVVATADVVVVVIGTPVDEHMNPDPNEVERAVMALSDQIVDGQLLVLRSTIYPGVTAMLERRMAQLGKQVDVAFCPERIAQGKALEELVALPQIVGGRERRAVERASALFRTLTDDIVEMLPEEAELAKLFTNTWRYIKFAAVNQLFMIANEHGLDFERIRAGIVHEYPRAADMPGPGFAAGPCLLKDTMQLAAFNNNDFVLGHASMSVNEGLPLYLVARAERRFDLAACTVGILGMSFKAGSDDIRSSLSYKLKRILRFKAASVLCTDPYVTVDPDLVPLERVLGEADVLVIGTPHPEYRSIETDLPVIDVWNIRGHGVHV